MAVRLPSRRSRVDQASLFLGLGTQRVLGWVRARRWAAFSLMVLLYALALPPLVVLYESKGPQLLAALGAALVGFLFCAALLALAHVPFGRVGVYALAIGLVLGELAWAVSYWSVAGLIGGALLWLAFYVLAGVSQAHLEGALDRRVALEYTVVAGVGLAIILTAAPWR